MLATKPSNFAFSEYFPFSYARDGQTDRHTDRQTAQKRIQEFELRRWFAGAVPRGVPHARSKAPVGWLGENLSEAGDLHFILQSDVLVKKAKTTLCQLSITHGGSHGRRVWVRPNPIKPMEWPATGASLNAACCRERLVFIICRIACMMRPIATDGVAWSVCVSVCWLHVREWCG